MAWAKTANLKGPKGDTGATGTAGATGATGTTGQAGPTGPRGATWHDGTGAPAGVAGSQPGDYYLDNATGDVYKLS